jgi:hypothetical protein
MTMVKSRLREIAGVVVQPVVREQEDHEFEASLGYRRKIREMQIKIRNEPVLVLQSSN